MKEYTSILVPTDFSHCADKALEYGKDFAKRFNAQLHVLYVVEPIETFATINCVEQSVYIDIIREVHTSATERMNKLQADLKGFGYDAQCVVREGRPSETIVEYAKENSMSMICLATHGRSGLNHLLLGSTTEKILRKAECPVFVVRSTEE